LDLGFILLWFLSEFQCDFMDLIVGFCEFHCVLIGFMVYFVVVFK